ncbi:hypothetical protein [Thermomonas aquatica]|uniref:Oxygen-independent coproporphyrinogen III oxidase n=1 Tax=Thermomonas aquatica TaxID=2202149 RepID=A0A5B7ZRI4_9GAMM|nr:hypothetical protein [Thermomonas aquatica]QDA57103.1 hypothetical protein FHQ07_07115 [Thermomonas aquatica]
MNPASPSPIDRLVRCLEFGGGRYALYPPPRTFADFTDAQFTAAICASNGDPIPPQLALHFDVPAAYRSGFCGADAPLGQRDRARAHAYRDRLVREVGLVGDLFDRDRDVVGVSLAPGMTRWMSPAQVAELLESLGRHFHVHRHGVDLAMTLDLDDPTAPPLRAWAELGFNRVSISLSAIAGSERPAAEVARHVERARNAGFANLRVEVPYGLPGQSAEAFEALLAAVLAAEPERVGLRHCPAPEHDEQVAESPARLQAHARMLIAGADALEAAGYLHVGVDLFARPNDPLVVAQRHQRLHRDALGFGAHGATHLVGFGVGAISQLGGCHAQNPLDLATWEARIDQGKRAVQRGIDLCPDDDVRAELLQRILCYGRIDTRQLEHHHHIRFREYFADDLLRLAPLFEAGSLRWDADAIVLDRCARLASRSIASQFDPRSAASDCPG